MWMPYSLFGQSIGAVDHESWSTLASDIRRPFFRLYNLLRRRRHPWLILVLIVVAAVFALHEVYCGLWDAGVTPASGDGHWFFFCNHFVNNVNVIGLVFTFLGLFITVAVLERIPTEILGYGQLAKHAEDVCNDAKCNLSVLFQSPNFGYSAGRKAANDFVEAICKSIGKLAGKCSVGDNKIVVHILMPCKEKVKAFIEERASGVGLEEGRDYRMLANKYLCDLLEVLERNHSHCQLYLLSVEPFTSIMFLSESRCILAETITLPGRITAYGKEVGKHDTQYGAQSSLLNLLIESSQSTKASPETIHTWLEDLKQQYPTPLRDAHAGHPD